jgi:hypothetical protein
MLSKVYRDYLWLAVAGQAGIVRALVRMSTSQRGLGFVELPSVSKQPGEA